jgi:hypothetical protein
LYGLPPAVLKEYLLGAFEAHSAANVAPTDENFEDFI